MNPERPSIKKSDRIRLVAFLSVLTAVIIIARFIPNKNLLGLLVALSPILLSLFPKAFLKLIWWLFVKIIRAIIGALFYILHIPSQIGGYFVQNIPRDWLVLGIILIIAGLALSERYFQAFEPAEVTYTYHQDLNGTIESTDLSLTTDIKALQPVWDAILRAARLSVLVTSTVLALPFAITYLIVNFVKELLDNIEKVLEGCVVLVLALIFVCYSGFSLGEAIQRARTAITPTIASPTMANQKYYLVFVDIFAPSYVEQGESQIARLDVGIVDDLEREGVLIPLASSSVYTVTTRVTTVNFALVPHPQSSIESRTIEPNEVATWDWILEPKSGVTGRQAILWDVQIDDGLGGVQARSVSISIEVRAKPVVSWQIPVWLLRPEFQASAIVGGWIVLLLGYLTNPTKKRLQVKRVSPFPEQKRPNTVIIREMIGSFFNDEELMSFCYDYFPEVFRGFSVGMSKNQKIQLLLDYCERRDRIEQLLTEVEYKFPVLYDIYKDQIW